ncbi:MAG: 50S ribosomal protein P1 [Candidatus Heimdallarchaeota archaeon]
MEYLHAALLLHSANKPIDEASLSKVLKAAGLSPDEARIKALVAALDGVDIDEAIKTAPSFAVAPAAAAAPTASSAQPAVTKEKVKEEKKEEEEEDLGLSSLFG